MKIRKKISGFIFTFIFSGMCVILCVAGMVVHIGSKYDMVYFWKESQDYDKDKEFDVLYLLRSYKYDGIEKSYYKIEFADGSRIAVGPWSGSDISAQVVPVLEDGRQGMLLATTNDFAPANCALYEKVSGRYKRLNLPVPESIEGEDGDHAGYDIYVLSVDDNTVTVGNDMYGIRGTFQIQDELIEVYSDVIEVEVIGDCAWRVLPGTKDGEIQLYIQISPKEQIDIRTIVVSIKYSESGWIVLNTEVAEN